MQCEETFNGSSYPEANSVDIRSILQLTKEIEDLDGEDAKTSAHSRRVICAKKRFPRQSIRRMTQSASKLKQMSQFGATALLGCEEFALKRAPKLDEPQCIENFLLSSTYFYAHNSRASKKRSQSVSSLGSIEPPTKYRHSSSDSETENEMKLQDSMEPKDLKSQNIGASKKIILEREISLKHSKRRRKPTLKALQSDYPPMRLNTDLYLQSRLGADGSGMEELTDTKMDRRTKIHSLTTDQNRSGCGLRKSMTKKKRTQDGQITKNRSWSEGIDRGQSALTVRDTPPRTKVCSVSGSDVAELNNNDKVQEPCLETASSIVEWSPDEWDNFLSFFTLLASEASVLRSKGYRNLEAHKRWVICLRDLMSRPPV